MQYPELKIKIKSLADEARTIRTDERKHLNAARAAEQANKPGYAEHRSAYGRLRSHRIFDVRIEQRATLVAYAYLRGKAYRNVEQAPHWLKPPYCRPGPAWDRVLAMCVKYGQLSDKNTVREQLKTWREAKPLQQAA